MNDTADAGAWAHHRGQPDAAEIEYICGLLKRHPAAAVARMSGRSVSLVRSIAFAIGATHARDRVTKRPKVTVRFAQRPDRKVPGRSGEWRQSIPFTAKAVIQQIADRHNQTFEALIGGHMQCGPAALTAARQEAYHAVRALQTPEGRPRYSLPLIGSWFGGRDHTTVMHGLKAHEARIGGGG